MDTIRNRYSSEFKSAAVELAVTSGKSMAEIERDLGLRAGLLKHWVRKVKTEGAQAFPGHGRQKAEEEEMRRLKRELEIVCEERDILKKAVAIFSRDPARGMASSSGNVRSTR